MISYGHNKLLKNNKLIPEEISLDKKIIDCDVDVTHAAYLDSEKNL